METQGVSILGATGSIGLSTLDVLARHPDKYHLVAVTANTSVEKMLDICRLHKPRYAVMSDTNAAQNLAKQLSDSTVVVLGGKQAVIDVGGADEAAIVMAAIVGAAGLTPTMAAVCAGKKVLLANKEALVTAGQLFMDAVATHKATLLPIDSEHNAIFQCLPNGKDHASVTKILLTASGGPFRTKALSEFASITPDQACAHPNWRMGRKISVDSATMMNKGLELIEACWLFGKQASDIDVVVHPQSIIHSMVAYNDGSVIAQLGNPDMRTPIAYGLAWPNRIESGVELLDIIAAQTLNFEAPDDERFPLLTLAKEAWQAGGNAAVTMNAANEIAVEAFLNGQIRFIDIAPVVAQSLEQTPVQAVSSLDEIDYYDSAARRIAAGLLKQG